MEKLDLFNVMENSRRVCLSNLLIAVVFLCVFFMSTYTPKNGQPNDRHIGEMGFTVLFGLKLFPQPCLLFKGSQGLLLIIALLMKFCFTH